MVICMFEVCGILDFGLIFQEFYGLVLDVFYVGDLILVDFGLMFFDYLNNIVDCGDFKDEFKILIVKEVVLIFQVWLNIVFGEEEGIICVFEFDGIVVDVVVGVDYIKVCVDVLFNECDVCVLEVYEGLVYVGIILNGLSQLICIFFVKGLLFFIVIQEGLVILMEVIVFVFYLICLCKLINCIWVIYMVEEGVDFFDVFYFYCEQGYSLEDSYQNVSWVFCGLILDGLLFIKDLFYLKGFIFIYNYIQFVVCKGKFEQIFLLFCGKIILEDMCILC